MARPADRRVPLTWTSVPDDYAEQIHALRRARGLSQAQLATLVGTARKAVVWCFRHQLLLPRPYLVLTKPLRLDIQCQRAASVKIGWKYLDD